MALLSVADAILKIAKKHGNILTPMQLMKLTYIANGFALAILDKPLFRERIEAWRYGPVMPELYQATKQYGKNPIPHDAIDSDDDLQDSFDHQELELLEEVYETYKGISAIDLSTMTHEYGSPWHQVYNGNANQQIPQDLIKEHYLTKVEM